MSTPSLPSSPITPFHKSPERLLIQIALVIGITALLGSFASWRFQHAGQWLPSLPDDVGVWRSVDTPIDEVTLSTLGHPLATARLYTNPFGEQVLASLVSAGPFENYHDPTVCVTGNGFALTSKKTFGLSDDGKVRAMIFKKDHGMLPEKAPDQRIVMYYWQQNKDGSSDTEARMGTYRDMESRFKTGYGAVVQGRQTVIVRIYTFIMPWDKEGAQAQRNVDEVSKAVFASLKKEGSAQ